MNKFYPHINSFKKIQDLNRFVSDFSNIDFDKVYSKTFQILTKINVKDNDLKSILNISLPILIINISNIIFSNKNYLVKKNFDLKNKIDNGYRSLGGDYIPNFFKGETKVIYPFIKGFFYPDKKEFLKNLLFFFSSNKNNLVFSHNQWLLNYLKEKNIKYTKVSQDYFWNKSENPNITSLIVNENQYKILKNKILNELNKNFDLTKKEFELLNNIVNELLNITTRDFFSCKKKISTYKKLPNSIYVGTSGAYLTRIILENFNSLGVKTFATLHSGTIGIFNYKIDERKIIEYLIPKNFIVSGLKDLELLKNKYHKSQIPNLILSNDEIQKTKILDESEKIIHGKKIKKVIYVSPNFCGYERYGVLNEFKRIIFEYNLLKYLVDKNYEVIYKIHPKGIKFDTSIFDFKGIKFSKAPIKSLIDYDRFFIFNLIDSTAFNEVISDKSPSIVISENQKKIIESQPLKILEERVHFVDLKFEKNNLPKINFEQLEKGLNRNYLINYKFKFLYQ